MHHCTSNASSNNSSNMDAQSFAPAPIRSHKRRRSDARVVITCGSDRESCCSTSGESSGDENDAIFELELEEEEQEAAAKRRRRADLDGLKKSVRHMEAQVVDASAQLRDLAALVAQVVAQRQQQRRQLA